MRRIHLLCEQFGGKLRSSSFVRLLQPLGHPANAAEFTVSRAPEYEPADIVVVERTWLQDLGRAEDLVRSARRDRACLIYSIDDDLLILGRQGPLRQPSMTADKVRLMELLAREADGVIVSTDRLKRRMLFYNNTVITVPNCVDERLFPSPPRRHGPRQDGGGRLVVGYMGTSTHDADLALIADGLRSALRNRGGALELELVGVVSDERSLGAFDGLPCRLLRRGDATDYPDFIRWMSDHARWDLAISPLRDDEFTRCKSDLKFLDYGALGIPGIYSRLPTYSDSVIHLDTGYLADNSPHAWAEAVERMAVDDALRTGIARRAREYVFHHRTLDRNASHWRDAILSIHEGRRGSAASVPPAGLQRRKFVERVRRVVCERTPADSTIVVVGQDGTLLAFSGRHTVALPLGHGADAAVSHLEHLRRQGARYLLLPRTEFWRLSCYAALKRHLEARYPVAACEDSCLVYSLN